MFVTFSRDADQNSTLSILSSAYGQFCKNALWLRAEWKWRSLALQHGLLIACLDVDQQIAEDIEGMGGKYEVGDNGDVYITFPISKIRDVACYVSVFGIEDPAEEARKKRELRIRLRKMTLPEILSLANAERKDCYKEPVTWEEFIDRFPRFRNDIRDDGTIAQSDDIYKYIVWKM